jgi:hypothetical protein
MVFPLSGSAHTRNPHQALFCPLSLEQLQIALCSVAVLVYPVRGCALTACARAPAEQSPYNLQDPATPVNRVSQSLSCSVANLAALLRPRPNVITQSMSVLIQCLASRSPRPHFAPRPPGGVSPLVPCTALRALTASKFTSRRLDPHRLLRGLYFL